MMDRKQARLALGAPLVASSLMLAGCIGSPTYGTDKSAAEQLTQDVTGILSITPNKKPQIDYKPRPDLVRPASLGSLPPPQQKVAVTSNPAWPESPEQRRARVRAEATANQDNSAYDSPVISDVAVDPDTAFGRQEAGRDDDSGLSQSLTNPQFKNARAEYKKRRIETKQGSATTRKYLSEPPLAYRQPASSAPTNDIGEDEYKKERRAKAAARKKGDWSWRQLIPGM
ncbi:MAG: hypothetical protein ABWY13_07095 [Mesorhizobium sp.]|jgi:hypothetical protein